MRLPLPLLFGITWLDPNWLLDKFGPEFFWISLLMIFVECGLFFPFLPGDTLLFAIGLFIAGGRLHLIPGNHAVVLVVTMAILMADAVLGNIAGYEIGRRIGPRIFQHDGRIIKRAYLEQTQQFFDRHGSKALVIGRFVPFVRTYVTLVAGVVRMDRRPFVLWSGVGAVLWVLVVTLLGFFLGSAFPTLGENMDKAILVLLAFSVVPVAWEWWRHRRGRGRGPEATQTERSNVRAKD
ncbi:MAG: DedA family protein [Marmoricola sp.]